MDKQRSREKMNYGSQLESAAESGRFGDVGANIPVKLTKDELRDLSHGQAVARVRAHRSRVGVDRGDNLSVPAILASDAVRVRGRVHRIAAARAAGPDARRRALPAAEKSVAERLDVGSSVGLAASGHGATVSQKSFSRITSTLTRRRIPTSSAERAIRCGCFRRLSRIWRKRFSVTRPG